MTISDMMAFKFTRIGFVIGLFGVVQYLVVTTILMQYYPGGTVHAHGAEGFSFAQNFMSDLGRTTNFGRQVNPTAPYYTLTLGLAGICTAVFFLALTSFMVRFSQHIAVYICMFCGMLAGLGYVGIALNPVNTDYHMHVWFVQFGFIAFWLMTVSCATAIYRVPVFSKLLGHTLLVFALLLGIQILIMILGPRSWSSSDALYLQVIAQKVVVYSEILVMCLLGINALLALRRSY